MDQKESFSTPYYIYIVSLLKKDNFGCYILDQTAQKGYLDKWPYCDSYDNFINDIVSAGKKTPIKSIRTIYDFVSTFETNDQLKPIFQIENNEEREKLMKLLLYFIFADTLIQLLEFGINTKEDNINLDKFQDLRIYLFDFCTEKILKMQSLDEKQKIILNRLIKQCSIILFYFKERLQSINDNINNLLSQNSEIKSNTFILFRFLAKPVEFIGNVLASNVDNGIKYECIRSALLQIPKGQYNFNNIEGFNNDFYKKHFDIRALCISRDSSTTFESIKTFIKKNESDIDLRGFLHLLRDPEFCQLIDILKYGEINEYSFLLKEKDGLAFKEENFIDIFFKYVVDKINIDNGENIKLSTQIIINLLARNTIQCIKRFCNYLNDNDSNKVAFPFFRALTIVFDKNSGIFNDTQNDELSELKTLIKDKYKNFEINISTDPSYCKTTTVQECESLSPYQNAKPQISDYAFSKRLEEAQNITTGIITDQNDEIERFFPGNKEKKRIDIWNISKEKIEIQIIINIITILFHIIIDMDVNTDLFIPLVKMALHNKNLNNVEESKVLQYFSLYAIQVFYIKKRKKTRFSILSAINKVMIEHTFFKKNAFTLLNLLNHIFQLPVISVNMKNENELKWFNEWSNELQAILLVHLTSPFVHVRDMTLLVMDGLSKVLPERSTNIVSLMDTYDKDMIANIAKRLRITCDTLDLLNNLKFKIIMRSSNFPLSIYALIEYAQSMSRNSMSEVLKNFYDFKLYNNISNNNEIPDDLIRYFAFAQRICPMFSQSKNEIIKLLKEFPKSISLQIYRIKERAFSINDNDDDYREMINSFKAIVGSKLIENYCSKLNTSDNKKNFYSLVGLSTSLSIELFSNFIKGFSSYLENITKNPTDSFISKRITEVIRLSIIIRNIVESPDFVVFVYSNNDSSIYSTFINWFLKIYPLLPNDEHINYQFLLCFFLCIISFSKSASKFRERTNIFWPIESRQECFKFLLPLLNTVESEMTAKTILKIIKHFPIFDEKYKINSDIFQSLISIEINNPSSSALTFILARHPMLFDDFFSRSIIYSIQDSFYYFKAICGYFNMNFKYYNQKDMFNKINNVTQHSGKLILSSLIFIGTEHEVCRKSAFSLLKCVLPIICALKDQNNIENAGIINRYLNDHQKELCDFNVAPSPQQVFELAKCIADNLPCLVSSVFEAFFSFFKSPKDINDFIVVSNDSNNSSGNNNNSIGLTQISPDYYSLLLNAVSPFAGHLIFAQGSPVYPPGLGGNPNKNGIQFVNSLINIHAHLSKYDFSFYVKILCEACNNKNNIRNLAKIMIMNANSQNIAVNPNILNATSTLLVYLIQNFDSVEFISLLVQPLSFGFWFTNKFGSTEMLSDKPYHMHDWLYLSLKVLNIIAYVDFICLLPYIHTILHYCLIFNNSDEKINLQLSTLLNIIIQTVDYTTKPIPDDVKIDFIIRPKNDLLTYIIKRTSSKMLPISIKSWKEEALQWATSCGDLIIANKSAVIYSLIEIDYNNDIQMEMDSKYKDLNVILQSLYFIFRGFELNYSSNENQKNIFKDYLFCYVYGLLNMLLSNITFKQEVTFNNDWNRFLNKIMKFSINVLSIAHINSNPPKVALKIINTILNVNINALNDYYEEPGDFNEVLNNPEIKIDDYKDAITEYYKNRNDYYEYLSKLIVASINQPSVAEIFIKMILHTKFKIISLGHLLIFYYATISAYQSINPFATIISEDFKRSLNQNAEQIINSDFEDYKQIFSKSFQNKEDSLVFVGDETPNCIDFIDTITKEIWKSNCVPYIVKFYNYIINVSYLLNQETNEENGQSLNISSIIRDIVYTISKSFIDKCPNDKIELIPIIFKDIIPYAIYDNTKASRELVSANMEHSLYENPYDQEKIEQSLKIKWPVIPESRGMISESYLFVTKSRSKGISKLSFKYSPIIDFRNVKPSTILMVSSLFAVQVEDLRSIIYGSSFQPFEEQMTFWNKANEEKFPDSDMSPKKISPFDVFAQSQSCTVKQKSFDELFAGEQIIAPESFILRNDELDSYERRSKK